MHNFISCIVVVDAGYSPPQQSRISIFDRVARLDYHVLEYQHMMLCAWWRIPMKAEIWRRPPGHFHYVWFNRVHRDADATPLSMLWRFEIARGHRTAQRSIRTIWWWRRWCMCWNEVWMSLTIVAGWEDESTNCTRRSDDCLNHRCLNGATCVDGFRSYTCLCPPGYTGNIVIMSLASFGSTTTHVKIQAADKHAHSNNDEL